jgi:DNA primase
MSTGRKSNKPTIQIRKDPTIKALPEDFTFNIPEEGMRWLRSVNITQELCKLYNIGYSAGWERVILPSYLDGQLLGWQGRFVPFDSLKAKYVAKYLQAEGQKPLLFFSHSARRHPEFVVLVEDIASAIVLGRHMPTIALLGTSLDREGKQVAMLAATCKNYIIWLDGDKAGIEATAKIQTRLDNVGLVLEIVRTEKDPKYVDHYNPTSITQDLRRRYEIS